MPTKGSLYNLENVNRQIITPQNLLELGIDESILNTPALVVTDSSGKKQKPIGISINGATFGDFPDGTAESRGWYSYMNIGAPMIEERKNITQPPPDTLSSRTYVNRDSRERFFADNVNFEISNTITWNIQGTAQLTFGVRGMSSLTKTVETKYNARASYDQGSVDVTYTDTAAAHGEGEVYANLMLAIQGSVGGSLTTSWKSTSGTNGSISAKSRIRTLVTQRRVIKRYNYTIPVTFAGFIAVRYASPVPIKSPPQTAPPNSAEIVAQDINVLNLVGGKPYRVTGLAETVSALEVDHIIFETESMEYSEQELYRKP
ncbi:hypothetical protein OO184_22555 [Photorhabdus sp. APURE]|uniref:hypothetical protein n=1 Tax=Photorhabdus aballayi TaxID=2991723 RepID=UPI00223E13E8|nr:hypothetical protein [Photorhabdus aballayi]MCW7550635.1 hypothetical protein [Photorhabdus aballayi]